MLKYIDGEPSEGTPVVGVVYYILRQEDIEADTGAEPIGYVIEDSEEE